MGRAQRNPSCAQRTAWIRRAAPSRKGPGPARAASTRREVGGPHSGPYGLADADATQGGHAFRIMAAYETWFGRAGGPGARELAALRLLGFFDRPAEAGCLAALRQAPPMAGLTEPDRAWLLNQAAC